MKGFHSNSVSCSAMESKMSRNCMSSTVYNESRIRGETWSNQVKMSTGNDHIYLIPLQKFTAAISIRTTYCRSSFVSIKIYLILLLLGKI